MISIYHCLTLLCKYFYLNFELIQINKQREGGLQIRSGEVEKSVNQGGGKERGGGGGGDGGRLFT